MAQSIINPEVVFGTVLFISVSIALLPFIPPQISVLVLVWGTILGLVASFAVGSLVGQYKTDSASTVHETSDSVTTVEDVHEQYIEGEIDDDEFEEKLRRAVELEE